MIMGDLAINGDSAVALAWKQIDPDVCAAYPITPQTIIVEKFSDYVADGDVQTEFVCVESEHSALTVCTGSGSAGASVVSTGTAVSTGTVVAGTVGIVMGAVSVVTTGGVVSGGTAEQPASSTVKKIAKNSGFLLIKYLK
jgi:pyruvate/2-oxoacid:ferredoxin oxidoreductase alpha subunit